MKLLGAVLGFLGCLLLWALADAVSELLGDSASAAVAPARKRVWQAFVRARWHWPLLLMGILGVAGLVAGDRLRGRFGQDWRGDAGLLVYFAGGVAAAVAAFLWRHARRARGREAARESANGGSRPAA